MSGSSSADSVISPVDITGTGAVTIPATARADFDVIANNTAVGPFARIDLHGSGGSPCTFWWMVIPSS
jgi:hypothetical protein